MKRFIRSPAFLTLGFFLLLGPMAGYVALMLYDTFLGEGFLLRQRWQMLALFVPYAYIYGAMPSLVVGGFFGTASAYHPKLVIGAGGAIVGCILGTLLAFILMLVSNAGHDWMATVWICALAGAFCGGVRGSMRRHVRTAALGSAHVQQ